MASARRGSVVTLGAQASKRDRMEKNDANEDYGIWSPYEAFYLASLLYCTRSALRSATQVRNRLRRDGGVVPESHQWHVGAHTILNAVQNIAIQGAALSRFFWPSRDHEPHRSRAASLRVGFGIGEDSPLRDRGLRNQMEHFDEELDRFCGGPVVGDICPEYVGPFPGESDVPRHVFRAYYTDQAVFEVLSCRHSMQPIVDEITTLDERLRICCNAGYRIPKTRAETTIHSKGA